MRMFEYMHLLDDYEEWVGPRQEVHDMVAYHGIEEGVKKAEAAIKEALARRPK
jgi:hypothetical protein